MDHPRIADSRPRIWITFSQKWNFGKTYPAGVKDSATLRTTASTARIRTDKNQPGYRGADLPTETLEGLICSPNIFRFDRKSGVAAVKIQIPESISL